MDRMTIVDQARLLKMQLAAMQTMRLLMADTPLVVTIRRDVYILVKRCNNGHLVFLLSFLKGMAE